MRRVALADVALARPISAAMILVTVMLLGAIALTRLPLAFLPTAQSTRLYVRIDVRRTSPTVLDRQVVRPLEALVAGMPGLERIQVGTGSWGVRMNLEFVGGTDATARKMELRDRVDRFRPQLPSFVDDVEIGTHTFDDEPILKLRVSAEDGIGDHALLTRHLVRPIERVAGVSRVELSGVSPMEIEVALDPDKVRAAGVDVRTVGSAVADAARRRSLGELARRDVRPGVGSPAPPVSTEAYGELPLLRRDGSVARISELADVRHQPEAFRGGERLGGRPAVNLSVFGGAGASTVTVTRSVLDTLERLRASPELSNVQVAVFRDEGEIILGTLRDLWMTGIVGGLLGVVVLFGFLHRVRTTLAAALAIPASVLVTAAVLLARGDELNCVVLLGLVLSVGMLIDNAVVMVEAITRHGRAGCGPLEAASRGAREVGMATLAATLSSVIVFLPLLFGDPADRMSAYLRPLGVTFTIALLSSLLISQAAVPLVIGRFLSISPKPTRHPWIERVSAAYGRTVTWTLRHRRWTLLAGFAVAGSAAVPVTLANVRLGDVDEQRDNVPIRLEFAGSTGYKKIEAHVRALEEALLGQKGALGLGDLSCSYRDWRGSCNAYPAEPFQSEPETLAFSAALEAALPQRAGVRYRVGESEWSHRRAGKHEVSFVITGEDMTALMELSTEVEAHLEAALDPDELDFVQGPFEDGSLEMHARLDGARLAELGLTPAAVADVVELSFEGRTVGRLPGPSGDLRLRLSAAGRPQDEAAVERGDRSGPQLPDLYDLRIPLPAGGDVPLRSLATVEQARAPHWTQRVDRQTEVRIEVKFYGGEPRENWQKVAAAMDSFVFPPGYQWGRGTQWRRQKQAQNDMLLNLGLCLLLVYAVMAGLFESYLQPLTILVACVLGAAGAPWLLWLTGTTIDTTAMVGLFILVGIVVNAGIMLVDRATGLRAEGLPRDEALAKAGVDRLRPILMTATTTVLGLVPMLVHHPTLAGVYYHSIAYIIAGGLVTSTIMTLLVLPAGYAVVEDVALAFRARFDRWSEGATPARGSGV